MYGLSNGMVALVRLKVTFAVLKLCNTHNLGNIAFLLSGYFPTYSKGYNASELAHIILAGYILAVGCHRAHG